MECHQTDMIVNAIFVKHQTLKKQYL